MDTLKKHEHLEAKGINAGKTSRGEINEGTERSKLKGKIETTNVEEASSGHKKKIDPEVEETLYLLKQRDQTLTKNLAAQTSFCDLMLVNQNERHQGFMDLEQRQLDIEEQRNRRLATQVESLLAIANNMARSLGAIVDNMKENPQTE